MASNASCSIIAWEAALITGYTSFVRSTCKTFEAPVALIRSHSRAHTAPIDTFKYFPTFIDRKTIKRYFACCFSSEIVISTLNAINMANIVDSNMLTLTYIIRIKWCFARTVVNSSLARQALTCTRHTNILFSIIDVGYWFACGTILRSSWTFCTSSSTILANKILVYKLIIFALHAFVILYYLIFWTGLTLFEGI